MRLVSQDRKFDLPYEQTMVMTKQVYGLDERKQPIEVYHINGVFGSDKITLGEYTSKEKVKFLMDELIRSNMHKVDAVLFPEDKDVVLPEVDNDNA